MTKEFKEKFVANIENRNDRIECKNLMQYVPQSLYQYKRGIAKNEKSEFYEINQLKNNKIWMSKVSKLNDPYDSAFLVDLKSEANLDNEELPDNVQQILEEYQKKLDIKSNDFKESIYISCFSESSQLLLMWSHYANSHKGFCIEYDYSKLQFMELSACPVLYNNNYNFSNLLKLRT